MNGGEVKTKQGEPFIYEGRTYVPLRADTEALGTEVVWDEQGSRVHITGKIDLTGKVYLKTVAARMQAEMFDFHRVHYAAILVNSTDQKLHGVSVLCKAVTKDGKVLDASATNVPDVESHTSTALKWQGDSGGTDADGLTALCELATPMG